MIDDCDNCGTEQVEVHQGIHGRARNIRPGAVPKDELQSKWCHVCRSLVRAEEPDAVNLAYCTNLILKALRGQP